MKTRRHLSGPHAVPDGRVHVQPAQRAVRSHHAQRQGLWHVAVSAHVTDNDRGKGRGGARDAGDGHPAQTRVALVLDLWRIKTQ